MKNRSLVLVVMLVVSCPASLVHAFDIGSMLSGLGTSFGFPPPGYTYSYEVWNDASVPIYTEQQDIVSFMGALFPGPKSYYGRQTLPSIFDAGGSVSQAVCHDQGYYFKLYIGTIPNAHNNSIYQQSLTQLPLIKRDPDVYYYHVFTQETFSQGNSVHGPAVETMGFQDPTQLSDPNSKTKGSVVLSSQLSSLSFYNSSGTDTQVSLTYGPDSYIFTLEKYSFNTLGLPTPIPPASSTTAVSVTASTSPAAASGPSVTIQAVSSTTTPAAPASAPTPPALPPLFSLRPNTLSFTNAATKSAPFKSFQLPSQGFDGFTYTIEVFQDPGQPLNVGIQGLTPGNYNVGVAPRIRDLTPCPCTLWYQSFTQAGSVAGYSDLPGQVWIAYAGVDSPVQMKITPGQSISWNLVRPLLSQGDQLVYFIYVATTDDAVAQKFVAKVLAQTLGQNIINQYNQTINSPVVFAPVNQSLDVTDTSAVAAAPPLTADQEVATLMGSLKIANGVIEDTAQGVIGYLVGADVFTSYGLGFGRFYYVLAPSVVSATNIVSLVTGYLDSTKTASLGAASTDIQTSITKTVTNWMTAYISKPADVQQQVQQYLITYGNTKIVTADGKSLTKFGQACLQSILTGTVSLKYPSMKLSTVTNQYVYDFGKAAPDKMPAPTTINQASLLQNNKVPAK